MNAAAPFQVFQIPLNGFAQAGFEGFFRHPTQVALDFAGIDRVTQIVPGAVLDEGDQVGISGNTGWFDRGKFFEQGTDAAHHVDVRLFVVSANVVRLADDTFGDYFEQRSCVILDEQPVADLQAVSVDRQRFAGQRVENHQRNQFFGEVERAIVVRAVGQQYRQPVGALPCADEVVRGRFAGGVR
ncbi:hypothetical protein D3C84_659830 [compost metagenome]